MPELESLLRLYGTLAGWVGLGLILGYLLPHSIPEALGKALFWVGAPLSIMIFLRQADLSAAVLLSPFMCWIAISLGAGLAGLWIWGQQKFWQRSRLARPTQGSFLLACMVGNTGYLGYPVTLAMVDSNFFGWAVFFDTIGSTLGAYGLGVVLAAHYGRAADHRLLQALLYNPALWSFFAGLGLRTVQLPEAIETGLRSCAWTVIVLSLILIGMRLGQLRTWQNPRPAVVSLLIKMLIVPLLLGLSLPLLGITGAPRLVIVLQMAMPPAFATLVIAEAYELDRHLTVTTLAIGSVGLLILLPFWLWLFAP